MTDPYYYEGESADLANEAMSDALTERELELGPEDDWDPGPEWWASAGPA
ncbi:hypothetical protein ACFV6B_12940 [Streptomyces microflavus]